MHLHLRAEQALRQKGLHAQSYAGLVNPTTQDLNCSNLLGPSKAYKTGSVNAPRYQGRVAPTTQGF